MPVTSICLNSVTFSLLKTCLILREFVSRGRQVTVTSAPKFWKVVADVLDLSLWRCDKLFCSKLVGTRQLCLQQGRSRVKGENMNIKGNMNMVFLSMIFLLSFCVSFCICLRRTVDVIFVVLCT